MKIKGKKKGLIGQGLLATLFICVAWQAAAENLLPNPGFDAYYNSVGDGMHPSLWSCSYGSNDQIHVVSSPRKEGRWALRLHDTGEGSVGLSSSWVDVTPGFNYTASVDVRCYYNSSTARMYLRFYDDSSAMLSSTSVSSTASSWSHLSKTVMAPENAVKAELLLYVSSGPETDKVFFDNAALVLADEILANGSFEGCATGELPPSWEQWDILNLAEVRSYEGTNVMWLSDAKDYRAKGAYILLPATSGTPYKCKFLAKKLLASNANASFYVVYLDENKDRFDSDGDGGDEYEAIYVTSTNWTEYEISTMAPVGTAYIQILPYYSVTATGVAVFKDIHLTEDYTAYYVSENGAGDGQSYSNPALYSSSALWSDVDADAAIHPVKVVFKTGGSYGDDQLNLVSMGNSTNRILLEGEKPFGTVFDGIYGIRIKGAENIFLENIHFNSETMAVNPLGIGYAGMETKNIHLDNCYFINLTNLTYAACSISETNTHDISMEGCIFIRIGKPNDGSHMLYCANGSHDVKLLNNHFEDGWGTYIKLRNAVSDYTIRENQFIQRNGYRTTSSKPFIHFSVINDTSPKEVLGTDYLIENNSFSYNLYSQTPLWILVSGDSPTNHPGYHEITLSEKNVIEGTGNSISSRNTEILGNFGVDIVNDWSVKSNSYSNISSVKFMMDLRTPPAGYYELDADLDALIDD